MLYSQHIHAVRQTVQAFTEGIGHLKSNALSALCILQCADAILGTEKIKARPNIKNKQQAKAETAVLYDSSPLLDLPPDFFRSLKIALKMSPIAYIIKILP